MPQSTTLGVCQILHQINVHLGAHRIEVYTWWFFYCPGLSNWVHMVCQECRSWALHKGLAQQTPLDIMDFLLVAESIQGINVLWCLLTTFPSLLWWYPLDIKLLSPWLNLSGLMWCNLMGAWKASFLNRVLTLSPRYSRNCVKFMGSESYTMWKISRRMNIFSRHCI